MCTALRLALAASLFIFSCAVADAQAPEWIWSGKPAENQQLQFRKSFTVVGKVLKAQVSASADDQMVLFLNGHEIGSSPQWKEPVKANVTDKLKGGENVIAVQAKNNGGPGGLVVQLELEQEYGKKQLVITNGEWLASTEAPQGWNASGFNAESWTKAASVAKLGDGPWGDVFEVKVAAATPAEALTVPEGFKVELLRSAQQGEGSWVSMAVDEKGRLYLSPQGKEKMLRVTLTGAGQIEKIDPIDVPVSAAMGMLWAFDSLYVNGQGPDGQAIYRLRDTNGDDSLDAAQLFKKVPGGGGEHGAHAIVLGPDKMLYIAHGNSTPPIEGLAPESPYRNFAEDHLLPRTLDPVASFFDKLKVPYGYVLRTDENGTKWELFAGGFRNQYDIDFNADGELFTYDSDMEWDVNLPWYRPTRILHITSGSEFGFREGSTKWPDYYPDSLPTSGDVGLGSPTGVKFGTSSNFPEKYKRAFFAMDWTYGRILAVHLQPKGASYFAANPLPNPYNLQGPNASEQIEPFVQGKGLPVTDLEFGKDGAMYFTVGGRGTQAGLYRVSYTGAGTAEPMKSDAQHVAARKLRQSLEAFHGAENPQAIDAAWPHLGHEDRFIRYAARLAVEAQPVAQWRDRALKEQNPRAALTALLALARAGSKADQEPLLQALTRFPLDQLDEEWKLNKLRTVELSFIRQGRPSDEFVRAATEKLSKQFPAQSYALNRELSQLLVFLEASNAIEKTLQLLTSSAEPAEQIWFAYVLREAKGWTPQQREKYFAWFNQAREYQGGNSFAKFILRIRDQALAKLSETERTALAAILDAPAAPKPAAAPAAAREFVKAWTMQELTPDLEKVGSGRSFARGKELYAAAQCAQCHQFGTQRGGNIGPEITAVSNRFNRHDLLESIIDPSKAISEQYASYILTLKGGETVMGQIVAENNDIYTVVTDPIAGTRREIGKSVVISREMSPASLMPPGLLNTLSKDEILDLLAYLESAGNEKALQFSGN